MTTQQPPINVQQQAALIASVNRKRLLQREADDRLIKKAVQQAIKK